MAWDFSVRELKKIFTFRSYVPHNTQFGFLGIFARIQQCAGKSAIIHK